MPSPVCPAPRVSLDQLTQTVALYFPNRSPHDLRRALSQQLNNPYDKPADGSNSYETISRAEAGSYIVEAQAHWREQGGLSPWDQTLMTTLQQIFFQGRTDWQMQNPEPLYPATITECADGDTCKAAVYEDLQCEPLTGGLRFSAVDTPESFVSDKLYRVRNQVTAKMGLSEAFQPLIQFRIRYLGKIASLVMKDFEAWLQGNGGHFAVSNSYIFFGDPKYQGLLQPYDKYGRRIVTLHANPDAIAEYLATRLPILMRTKGKALYEETAAGYRDLLSGINVPDFLGPQTLMNPALLFTPERGAMMADFWRSQMIPAGLGDDWIAAMILAGVAYYYPKYKNQSGDAYFNIQHYSQAGALGMWPDPVFQAMEPSGLATEPVS